MDALWDEEVRRRKWEENRKTGARSAKREGIVIQCGERRGGGLFSVQRSVGVGFSEG